MNSSGDIERTLSIRPFGKSLDRQGIFQRLSTMMFYIGFTALFAFATGFQVALAAVLMNWKDDQ
jgi:hypothetical protein